MTQNEFKQGDKSKTLYVSDKIVPKTTYYISNGVVSTPVREKGGVEDIYKGILHS